MIRLLSLAVCAMLLALMIQPARAASKDLGNGFADHGVCAPISNARGTVATVDGDGRNVVLAWLMDHRGGYSLLMIDATTGKAEQFSMPFPPPGESVDSPYASILSSGNKFYTLIKNRLVEFDPAQRKFTFCSPETSGRFAMSMTEDDKGVIWAVAYPQSGVVSFDPGTGAFRDYGDVYKQTWLQYPTSLAADDAGWIYFGLGHTASQIIALDPQTGKATPVLSEDQRKKGVAYVCRAADGRVYGQALRGETDNWIELHKGASRQIGKYAPTTRPIIAGNQTLFHAVFPDGSKIKECSLIDRKLVIETAQGDKEFSFDYESDGAIIESVLAAPDGAICGGTTFPMRFYSFNPKSDTIINRPSFDQWNAVARQGDHFFAAAYPGGALLEWDPARPWVNTEKDKPDCNPRHLTQTTPTIHRPHRLFAAPDGKTLIMGGTPAYGETGGGLLFWDRPTNQPVVLTDADVIPDQSTLSLVALPDGKLLGGTTTVAGTGGQKKAKQAELYIIDPVSRRVEWREPVIPGVQEYTDLSAAPGGQFYGIADGKVFFVFDPASRKVVQQQDVPAEFGSAHYHQGPRNFIVAPDGVTYILFTQGMARVEQGTHQLVLVARPPVLIDQGGDYLDGRIYFAGGSHLYSYKLPK